MSVAPIQRSPGRGSVARRGLIAARELLVYWSMKWYTLKEMCRSVRMPVIARFYGITIKMYFSQSEHGVPGLE